MERSSHIVMLPSPGMGHLIPFIELAKKLISLPHNFSVTLLSPVINEPHQIQKTIVQNLPQKIEHIFLPPCSFEDHVHPLTQILVALNQSIPSIREAFKSLITEKKVRVVAFVTDLTSFDAMDLASKEFMIPSYIYFMSAAIDLWFFLKLPELDESVDCEYSDLAEPIVFPGCVPLHGKDLMVLAENRKGEVYKQTLEISRRMRNDFATVKGILLNSFLEIEPDAIKAFPIENDLLDGKPPVYTIGPIVRQAESQSLKEPCLNWLDNQPNGSVLFVSFGSGGTLSRIQLNELALGLEKSGQRFVWTVKSPNDEISCAAFFTAKTHSDPFGFLPPGFLERTKDRGLVLSSWVPQVQVLKHHATGGFLTHCGWNSTLESIIHGVPLIVWPLYGEQKMNAVLLDKGMKVALWPKVSENGLFEQDEIAEVVKELMVGEDGNRVRLRMKELSEAAKQATNGNGASTTTLLHLSDQWVAKNQNN